jgi:hypothetical protein
VLNILGFVLDLVNKHIIWFYIVFLIIILYYLRIYVQAWHDRHNSIFTIEQEVAAHREGQAMSAIGVLLGLAVVITAVKLYIVPSIDLASMLEPTPTLTLVAPTHPLPTPTPTIGATLPLTPTATLRFSTSTPQPTPTQATATPAPTSPPAPAACPDGNVRITSPGMNAQVAGVIAINGTANDARFQFYKLEYAQGEQPGAWHVINSTHKNSVASGVLEQLNTAALPNGVYWLQLTVVNESGNFTTPCRVRIVVRN